MTNARRIGLLAALAMGAAMLAVLLLRRPSGDAPPPTAALVLPGTPAALYDAILPEIRERIARETKIVRIDSGSGAIAMRFSAYLEDHSVRLVEIALTPASATTTSAVVVSERFSFLPGRSRDRHDAELESSLAALVRRHAPSVAPAP